MSGHPPREPPLCAGGKVGLSHRPGMLIHVGRDYIPHIMDESNFQWVKEWMRAKSKSFKKYKNASLKP